MKVTVKELHGVWLCGPLTLKPKREGQGFDSWMQLETVRSSLFFILWNEPWLNYYFGYFLFCLVLSFHPSIGLWWLSVGQHHSISQRLKGSIRGSRIYSATFLFCLVLSFCPSIYIYIYIIIYWKKYTSFLNFIIILWYLWNTRNKNWLTLAKINNS